MSKQENLPNTCDNLSKKLGTIDDLLKKDITNKKMKELKRKRKDAIKFGKENQCEHPCDDGFWDDETIDFDVCGKSGTSMWIYIAIAAGILLLGGGLMYVINRRSPKKKI